MYFNTRANVFAGSLWNSTAPAAWPRTATCSAARRRAPPVTAAALVVTTCTAARLTRAPQAAAAPQQGLTPALTAPLMRSAAGTDVSELCAYMQTHAL